MYIAVSISLIFFEETAKKPRRTPYLSTRLLAENLKSEKCKTTDINILLNGG